MLTKIQTSHLKAFTCPSCGRPLGRFHCYPVTTDAILSRLTDTVPMHQSCAAKAAPLLMDANAETRAAIIWVVKSSSPTAPSSRLFERSKGDWVLHLQTPERIDFYIHEGDAPPSSTDEMQRPSYDQAREILLPAIRRAAEAAEGEEEIDEIARVIAALHHFLPAKK